MKKFSLGVLTCVVLLYGSAPVLAHGPGMDGPGGPRMWRGGSGLLLPPFMLQKLNLTEEQKTQVRGIMEDYRKTVQPLFQQLKTIQQGMTDKFYSPGEVQTTDLTSAEASQLQEQIKNAELNSALKVRAVLTADQLVQAAQLKAQLQAVHTQMSDLFRGQ